MSEPQASTVERRVRKAMIRHVVVLLFSLYGFFSLDRGNVGLAALEMNTDLGLSAATYGLGASLFTLAYLCCQIPATMTMQRWGAARGLAAVATAWGLASTLTAFVWDSWSFLAIRFLLGATEAGFGAFVVYYINALFPRNMRGLALSLTLVAVPTTMVIASPISGVLLDWNYASLRGWQWLFIVEGLPSVFLGLLCLKLIPSSVDDIRFLNEEEKDWLRTDLANAPKKAGHQAEVGTLMTAVRSSTVWVLGLTLFAGVLGTNTLLFWMPQMIEQMSKAGNVLVGWLNAVPWLAFAIGMLVMGRIADRVANKVMVVTACMLIAAAGFVIGGVAPTATLSFVGLLVGAFGIGSLMALFWTVPMQMLSGASLAGAFAAINVIGNSSGVFAHGLIGWLRDATGGFGATLLALSSVLIIAPVALNLFSRHQARKLRAASHSKVELAR